MNLVALSGNLGRAPKTGTTKKDSRYAAFRFAHNTGEQAHWFSVVCFGDVADIAADLDKGTRVAVTGYLRVNTFEGRDQVEIVATFIEVLSRPATGEEEAVEPAAA